MNEIWCVVEFDSDGVWEPPELFTSKKEAGLYISDSAIDVYNQIEKYPNSTIKVNCNTDLYGKVGMNGEYRIWKGFEITDGLINISLRNYLDAKEDRKELR